MNIHIHIHNHPDEETKKSFQLLNNKLDKIMTKVEELEQAVTDMQASIDTKQEAIATAIAAFEQTIADLTAQLANGATPAQVQAILDKVTAAKADLEATPTA